MFLCKKADALRKCEASAFFVATYHRKLSAKAYARGKGTANTSCGTLLRATAKATFDIKISFDISQDYLALF